MERAVKKKRMYRLQIRVGYDTKEMLDECRKGGVDGTPGESVATVVRRALGAYLRGEKSHVGMLFERLNRQDTIIETLSRRVKTLGELFFQYLDYFFYLWPKIPAEAKHERRELADKMMSLFMQSLKGTMAQGGELWIDLPEELQGRILESSWEYLQEDSPESGEQLDGGQDT